VVERKKGRPVFLGAVCDLECSSRYDFGSALAMTNRPRHYKPRAKPSQKLMRASYEAQRPIGSDAVMPVKKKHRKGDDELPESMKEQE